LLSFCHREREKDVRERRGRRERERERERATLKEAGEKSLRIRSEKDEKSGDRIDSTFFSFFSSRFDGDDDGEEEKENFCSVSLALALFR